MIKGRIVSNSNSKCTIKHKMNKISLLQNVQSLQKRVNNQREKPAYARFKIKQRNIFGLALIDSGNLVHSSIVSAEFWDAIGGKLNQTMDYKVGTADSQNKRIASSRNRRTMANLLTRNGRMLPTRTSSD